LRVLSYNILAPSYTRQDRYPFTRPELLSWEARRDRLVERILGFDADIVCLQEVEEYVFRFLQRRMEPFGFTGVYAQKAMNRPDGCATFFLSERLDLVENGRHLYVDGRGGPDSGHLALSARFAVDGRVVTVVNTHVRWDLTESRGADHIGFRQVTQLLASLVPALPAPVVVCGDFNVEPNSHIIRELTNAGFADAYESISLATANSECRAKRIDYLFFRGPLAAQPAPLPEIDDETPLPSETEPSDHLPISADFSWL
jgi:mRNA deadenylase 3'-5' endonuclease subunit Ccr4